MDNDDLDGKPDEDSPPSLSIGQRVVWCSLERTLVASDEIQVNVMQFKSVVYWNLWKWPNVVDIYCKRVDANSSNTAKLLVFPKFQ